jgi:aminoglycoside phosphotransferase (APT) family kinase protein
MDYVDGAVLRTSEDAGALAPGQAGLLSRRFVEMLARIHGMDVEAGGLAGFGRPEGYLGRQLDRWQRQWELSVTREMPGYDDLIRRLAAGLPAVTAAAPPGGLVHGDYRLDNMLIVLGDEPRISAVVDWEMSTLGDPLADLGLALVYWTNPGEQDWLALAASVTTAPGFATREQLTARYAEITGRDLSRIGYYMAFGCFKLAVVLEGIHARYLQRKTVGEGFEREGPAVPVLVERAHQMLDADGWRSSAAYTRQRIAAQEPVEFLPGPRYPTRTPGGLMRPGAPLSPVPHPCRAGPARELYGGPARRSCAGPSSPPDRRSAGGCLRPGAPLSPGHPAGQVAQQEPY